MEIKFTILLPYSKRNSSDVIADKNNEWQLIIYKKKKRSRMKYDDNERHEAFKDRQTLRVYKRAGSYGARINSMVFPAAFH